MTTRTPPAEVTATEFRQDIARILRDAHYRIPALVTNNGKPYVLIVHPDAVNVLDPERVDRALRVVIAELDYDLNKALECDEETGEDTYHKTVAAFIAAYDQEMP
jgi:hypothetical protein